MMKAASTLSGHSKALHEISITKREEIRNALLQWFRKNARDMPWRLPSVPFSSASYPVYVQRLYVCLLSETMLQQTQVATVVAYFNKWISLFPTIQDLAKATEEQVMAAWAGLGYYSRAKRLHQAAQYLVENVVSNNTEFPHDPEFWIKKVPGVGPYTAGAIISQSFDVSSAIVDGNVQRVLSRVLAVHGDTTTPKSAGSKLIWQRAGEMVIGDSPGELNQSLMELGATVCTPTLPSCVACPISMHCKAYQAFQLLKPSKPTISKFFAKKSETTPTAIEEIAVISDIEDMCTICPTTIMTSTVPSNPATYIQSLYPFKPPKKAQRQELAIVYILQNSQGQLLLLKKAKGLLAGLFDFPTQLLDVTDDSDAIISRVIHNFGGLLKGDTLHLFTHIKRTSRVIQIVGDNAEHVMNDLSLGSEGVRWIDPEKLQELGVSELCLKNWRLASGATKVASKRKAEVLGKNSVKKSKIVTKNSKACNNDGS